MPVGVGSTVTVCNAISITAPFNERFRLAPSQNFNTGVHMCDIDGSWAVCITKGMLCFGAWCGSSAITACSSAAGFLSTYTDEHLIRKSQVSNAVYLCVINKNFLAS